MMCATGRAEYADHSRTPDTVTNVVIHKCMPSYKMFFILPIFCIEGLPLVVISHVAQPLAKVEIISRFAVSCILYGRTATYCN